jgi:hypothetical protein
MHFVDTSQSLVLFEGATMDYDRYLHEVLVMTVNYVNQMFGNDLTLQQVAAKLDADE